MPSQNPIEIWYDDTANEVPPYTTYQKMQLCIFDPIDPAGATDLTLLDPLPGDPLPAGETSCLVRSIDIAGGMYVAYVYTTFDGGRLGVT